MRALFLLMVFCLVVPGYSSGLTSEGRPGIPYFGHVLFLQQKVVENNRVVAASLAYSNPRDDNSARCSNTIDVFGGLELFRDIPEQNWVLVDYELQSILIEDGFTGDADVFKVSLCRDVETCLAQSSERNSDPQEQKLRAEHPRAKGTVKANFKTIQDQLEVGRKLVKAARCRGCHSLEGFGPDHAPSLTWKRFKYERNWLEDFINNPYRMRPAMSDLMMLKYTSPNAKPNLEEEELKLIAQYLTNVATASAPSDRYKRELWQSYDCFECHSMLYKASPLTFKPTQIPRSIRDKTQSSIIFQTCLGCHPFGDLRIVQPTASNDPNAFATDLLLAFEKLSLNYLTSFLAKPSYLEPETRMPDLGLSEQQIEEIRNIARLVKDMIENGNLKPIHMFYEMEPKNPPAQAN